MTFTEQFGAREVEKKDAMEVEKEKNDEIVIKKSAIEEKKLQESVFLEQKKATIGTFSEYLRFALSEEQEETFLADMEAESLESWLNLYLGTEQEELSKSIQGNKEARSENRVQTNDVSISSSGLDNFLQLFEKVSSVISSVQTTVNTIGAQWNATTASDESRSIISQYITPFQSKLKETKDAKSLQALQISYQNKIDTDFSEKKEKVREEKGLFEQKQRLRKEQSDINYLIEEVENGAYSINQGQYDNLIEVKDEILEYLSDETKTAIDIEEYLDALAENDTFTLAINNFREFQESNIDREKEHPNSSRVRNFISKNMNKWNYKRGGGRKGYNVDKQKNIGVDCSGMIFYAMNQLGLKSPGITAATFYNNTLKDSINPKGFSSNKELAKQEGDLKPGDLVLWKSKKPEYNYGGNGVHHVALVSDPVMIDGRLNVWESTGKLGVHENTINIDWIKNGSDYKSDIHVHHMDYSGGKVEA